MRKRLAAPFVMTLAMSSPMGGCTRSGDQPPPDIRKDPTKPTPTTPIATTPTATTPVPTTTAAPEGSVVFDGYNSCYQLVDGEKKYVSKCPEALLPEAPEGVPTYSSGGYCHRVGNGRIVRCPLGGPTLIVPEPSQVPGAGGPISLRHDSMTCQQMHDMKCPPGALCNPPPPSPTPCPKALLPKLSPGVKPTKVDGTKCFYQTVEVACP